jgi:hypothetical protein
MTMANKKKIEERERALQKKRAERTIQIVGFVVLVLIAAGLTWLLWPEPALDVAEVPTGENLFYDVPPPMTIDVNKKYLATFKMANGGELLRSF